MSRKLYDIEIFQGYNYFKLKNISHITPERPLREFKAPTFEELMEQMVKDILEDHEE